MTNLVSTILTHEAVQHRLQDARTRLRDAKRIRDFYWRHLYKQHIEMFRLYKHTSDLYTAWSLSVGRAKRELKDAIRIAEAKLGREHRRQR